MQCINVKLSANLKFTKIVQLFKEVICMLTKDAVKKAFTLIAQQEGFVDGPLADLFLDMLPEIIESKGIAPDSEEAKLMDENYQDYVVPWYVDSIVTDELVDYLNTHLEEVPVVEFFKDGLSEFCIESVFKGLQQYFDTEYSDVVPLIADKRIVVLGFSDDAWGNVPCYDKHNDLWDFYYNYGGYVVALTEDCELIVYKENSFEFKLSEPVAAKNSLTIRSLVLNPFDYYLSLECLDDVVPEDFRDLYF